MAQVPPLFARVEELTLPQLAGLTVLDKQLVQPDGHFTPQGCGVFVCMISSAVCFVLYKGSRPFSALFPTYRKLSREDQRNWDTRYSSNFHALFCVYFAWLTLWKSDLFWKEGSTPQVYRTSPLTYMALGVSVGYFLVDMVTCVKYNMGGTEMVLHHLGSLASVSTALITGDAHMHTIWMLLTEFTTPLINNRWWLDKMDMKDSLLYVVNGVAILVSWIFARLAVFPPFFTVVYATRADVASLRPLSLALVMVVPVVLFALNLYWFSKIVRGVYKVLVVKQPPTPKAQSTPTGGLPDKPKVA